MKRNAVHGATYGVAAETGEKCGLVLRPQRSVQVERRADQGEVRERLGKVSQGLATVPGFLGVQPEMVGVSQHLLEHETGIVQTAPIYSPRPSEGFDKPESTDVERSLVPFNAVVRSADVVAINQTVGNQAPVRRRDGTHLEGHQAALAAHGVAAIPRRELPEVLLERGAVAGGLEPSHRLGHGVVGRGRAVDEGEQIRNGVVHETSIPRSARKVSPGVRRNTSPGPDASASPSAGNRDGEQGMREFRDKVAVVTGPTSRIGRALAQRFAAEGMKVVLRGSKDKVSAHCPELIRTRIEESKRNRPQSLRSTQRRSAEVRLEEVREERNPTFPPWVQLTRARSGRRCGRTNRVIWLRLDVAAAGIGSADRELGKARATERELANPHHIQPSHRLWRNEDTGLGKKLYVGNLPYSTGDTELREMFEQHGTVESAQVINDRETGRSRGFGFVEMDQAGADAAIKALDGQDMGGRSLRVNEAHERGAGGGGRGPRQGRY